MAIKDSINLIWESLLPLAPHLASLGLGLGIIHKNNYKMHHPLLNKPTFGISCLWNLGNCTFASVASAELLYKERPFLGIELKFSHCGCRGQHLNKVFTQRGKKMQVWRHTVAQKKKTSSTLARVTLENSRGSGADFTLLEGNRLWISCGYHWLCLISFNDEDTQL